MIKLLLSLFLLVVNLSAGYSFSGNVCISVLTSEPGQELYTLFGHTAIRIRNDSLRYDRVYNFGTFDFSSPFFFVNFLKGKLDYFLSVDDFSRYQQDVIAEKRKVHEQMLDLTAAEKQRIFEQLESIYHSPERFYRYDFFHDNCATRVRDAIFKENDVEKMADTGIYCCKTFRQLLLPYIRSNYWLNLGINLALGRDADKIAGVYESMFLPDYIMYILKDSHVALEEKVLIHIPAGESGSRRLSYVLPWMICFLLVIASLWHRTRRPALYLVTFVFGFLGLFLLFMGFFSDIQAFSGNLSISWTLPALAIPISRTTSFGKIYQGTYAFYLLVLLILCAGTHTGLSVTFIPWILVILVVILANLGVFTGKATSK